MNKEKYKTTKNYLRLISTEKPLAWSIVVESTVTIDVRPVAAAFLYASQEVRVKMPKAAPTMPQTATMDLRTMARISFVVIIYVFLIREQK